MVNAIGRHGGNREVAERLNLKVDHARQLVSRWKAFSKLERALQEFMQAHGLKRLPKTQELIDAQRFDLMRGVIQHGGLRKVRKRLTQVTEAAERTPRP